MKNKKEKIELKLKEVLQRELDTYELKGLANFIGVSPSVLHGWKNGVKPGRNIESLIRLSKKLGLKLEELLLNEKTDEVTKEKTCTIFTSTFRDGRAQYKISVEKVED